MPLGRGGVHTISLHRLQPETFSIIKNLWYFLIMDTATIEREALGLPASERAKLVHNLLLSLEVCPTPRIEEAWLDEAERRASEIDQGIVQPIPAEEVSRKARALLR